MSIIDNLLTKNTLFWGIIRLIIPLLVILLYFYILYNLYYRVTASIYRATSKDKGHEQHIVNKIL